MFVKNNQSAGLPTGREKGSAALKTESPKYGGDVDMLGSTGQGLGHLSDAHAIGRSPVPPMNHRFPKTITT